MTIKVKEIFSVTWNVKTKHLTVDVEPYEDKEHYHVTKKAVDIPNWEQMKNYPQEALDYFKKSMYNFAALDKSNPQNVMKINIPAISYEIYYIQPAEYLVNKWLKEMKIKKHQIISIQHVTYTEETSQYYVITYEDEISLVQKLKNIFKRK